MGKRFFRLWAALALMISISAAARKSASAATTRNKGIDPALLAKANAGDAEAQNQLGDMYYFGDDVRRDYAQAALWYSKAADQGNADSEYRIGGFYHYGFGVPKDDARAFVWMKKAAEQENADAEDFLAVFYASGWGVPQDDAHAIFWLRRAAEDGNADAQYMLGWAYEDGLHDMSQDYAKAYYWLDIAGSESDSRKERKEAVKMRDKAASHLTPAEQARMNERVREWIQDHPAKAQ